MGTYIVDGAIVTVRQYSMKHLIISPLLCLLLLNFSLTFVSARDVSRWKRQDELPEDFKCDYCSFCGKPCAKTCGLCGGCDLIIALGLNTAGLANFGVDVKIVKPSARMGLQDAPSSARMQNRIVNCVLFVNNKTCIV